jgi:hypothetical protein
MGTAATFAVPLQLSQEGFRAPVLPTDFLYEYGVLG